MSAMDHIIRCLHYLSWSIIKYETMEKQSFMSEEEPHTLSEDKQSLHDSKTN